MDSRRRLGRDQMESRVPAHPVADIDAVTPDDPVSFSIDRYDHVILVNSRALALAGITAQTPDPRADVIVRDPASQPTGALWTRRP